MWQVGANVGLANSSAVEERVGQPRCLRRGRQKRYPPLRMTYSRFWDDLFIDQISCLAIFSPTLNGSWSTASPVKLHFQGNGAISLPTVLGISRQCRASFLAKAATGEIGCIFTLRTGIQLAAFFGIFLDGTHVRLLIRAPGGEQGCGYCELLVVRTSRVGDN